MKRFVEWVLLKEKIDAREYTPPQVSMGDVWWCSVGENVGVEVFGKGERFSRPVIILYKFNQYSFLVIPLTSKKKKGKKYVLFEIGGIPQTALLNQIRTISYKRLDRKMASLSMDDFQKIKEALAYLLFLDNPR